MSCGGHARESRESFLIKGRLLFPDSPQVTLTVATKAFASDSFEIFHELPVELSPGGEFALSFEVLPSSVFGTNSRSCVPDGSFAPLVEIGYRVEGYISQTKRLALSAKELDLGEHSPVPISAEGLRAYGQLRELLETPDTSVALKLLSRIREGPFSSVTDTLRLMLRLRRGSIENLDGRSFAQDRFWGANCEKNSPFRFFTWPARIPVGPFEAREYTRSEILELARERTTAPFLELAKTLLSDGYRDSIADLPADYGRIYENLPVTLDLLRSFDFVVGKRASFDREAFLVSLFETFGSIGPRRLGDGRARRRFEAGLLGRLPYHDLSKEVFAHNHSQHGGITLTNFVAKPNYPHDKSILLATHYDSFSGKGNDPGANNGLSGVFALKLVINDPLFMNWAVANRIGIHAHFYDGETAGEPGLKEEYFLGSVHHSENNPEETFDFVICADMTGVEAVYERIYASVDRELMQNLLDIAYALGARMGERLQITDDHYVYHRRGIPSALLIRYRYPHYHTDGDSLDKLDPEAIHTTVAVIRNAILSLAMRK